MTSRDEVRLQLTLHYDGSRFFGWQSQARERTVQGELQAAVQRLTGRTRRVTGSGRTDRGVHATGQVAAVDVPSRWTAAAFRRALNAVLPDDIWVERARPVGPRFHPRSDAVARSYLYRVGTSEEARSPFHRPWCWPLGKPLDLELLRRCAASLVGRHAFRAFAKAGQPERGYDCHVQRAEWSPWDTLGVRFSVTADRFLHHMVRYLVGTMVDVARGRRSPEDVEELLAGGGGRLETSPPAPPQGLFLTRVDYPEESLRAEPERHPNREGVTNR